MGAIFIPVQVGRSVGAREAGLAGIIVTFLFTKEANKKITFEISIDDSVKYESWTGTTGRPKNYSTLVLLLLVMFLGMWWLGKFRTVSTALK